MTGKAGHPGIELLEYLSGRSDSNAALSIEEHLKNCSSCSSFTGLVRQLKAVGRADDAGMLSENHPDVGELAQFFYSKSSTSKNRATAAHIALCSECAADIAEYARAERFASQARPSQTAEGVPASAWRLIRDWEDSDFALPKETGLSLGPDLLEKLYKLLETAELPSAE